jgi:hypothetical protein
MKFSGSTTSQKSVVKGECDDMASSFERELKRLDEVIAKFKLMQIDSTEYACLKGIVLFKAGL